MSLLFAYVGNWVQKAGPTKNFYKLILAANRDERFSTPTVPVTFWDSADSHILAAQSVDPHENHGAWLGISKYGRFGAVLKIKRDLNNIALDVQSPHSIQTGKTLLSRAVLLPGYLKIGSSWAYCSKLCEGPEPHCPLKQYFPFHFIAIDLAPNSSEGSLKATYLTNYSSPDINHREHPQDITPPVDSCDFFAYGNSPIFKPFRKVVFGRQEFIDIISKHLCDKDGAVIASTENKQSIRDNLLNFLRSTKRYLPDPVISDYARASRVKEKIAYYVSSRFIHDFFDMGTRSQTIILVDTNNNVTFFEWHLKHPIYNPETSEWTESVHEFTLDSK